MSGPIDKELETIVNAHTQEFARGLAQEVVSHVLKRLGLTPSALDAGRPKAPASQKKKPAVKPAPASVKPAAKAVAKPAAKAPAKPARAKKSAPSEEDRSTIVERVLGVVTATEGVAVADVVKATGLPRAPVAAALKALKDERRIFMGGSRRFARYAMTPAGAEQASEAARRGG